MTPDYKCPGQCKGLQKVEEVDGQDSKKYYYYFYTDTCFTEHFRIPYIIIPYIMKPDIRISCSKIP